MYNNITYANYHVKSHYGNIGKIIKIGNVIIYIDTNFKRDKKETTTNLDMVNSTIINNVEINIYDPKFIKNLKTLNDISDLKYNWNDNGAEQFSNKLIEKVRTIVNNIVTQPIIYPTARKSIQLEWENKNIYIEFEIYENKVGCLIEKNGDFIVDTIYEYQLESEIVDAINEKLDLLTVSTLKVNH